MIIEGKDKKGYYVAWKTKKNKKYYYDNSKKSNLMEAKKKAFLEGLLKKEIRTDV